jgi:predicted CoA-binding protein
VKSLASIFTMATPDKISVSIVTPPAASLQAVKDSIAAGVTRIWLQPGAGSPEINAYALEKGVKVISDGPCVLVQLGVNDDD